MKIILSPSKTQNTDALNQEVKDSIEFSDLTLNLFNYFQSLTKEQLKATLKITGKLLEDTYHLYQTFNPNNKTLKAIDCYNGIAFEQIQSDTYNQAQISYLNNHLVILSAMYGPLKPNSSIRPYRLDMTIKPKNINLYTYWQNPIDKCFEQEDYIINLASNEFSKMLKNQKVKMINIYFLEEKEKHKFKIISYNAKKARGQMVHKLVLNQVKKLEDLKKIVVEDYIYNVNKSNQNNYYFIKHK